MFGRTCVLPLAMVTAAACAGMIPSANVRFEPPAVEQFAGPWQGTYSVESGKATDGTIAFALAIRDGSAAGRVELRAQGESAPYRTPDAAAASGAGRDRPASLALRILPASDGLIYGDVDAYWDAARGTAATMTLRGELRGDAIIGTFRTTYADGSEQTLGRWTANRVKDPE